MKQLILLLLSFVVSDAKLSAQSPTPAPIATETIQQSQSAKADVPASNDQDLTARDRAPLTIPAGTPIEVEAAYTVSSVDVKPGELLSFRVLIPVSIGGVVVIEKGALVTARVTRAKRGGHWGKAGRLAWSMQDVIAIDNTRIPLAPETSVRNHDWILLKPKAGNNESAAGGSIRGTSHGGEVATRTIISAAFFPPLALMNGFRRGGNAVLPEGKRFVVILRTDSSVTLKEKQ